MEIYSNKHPLIESTKTMPALEAFTRAQRDAYELTLARRDPQTGMIVLLQHHYKCADCFRSFPVPKSKPKYPGNEDGIYEYDYCGGFDEEDCDDWADAEAEEEIKAGRDSQNADFYEWALQLSLPGFDRQEEYVFRTLPESGALLTCPHCGHTACIGPTYRVFSNDRKNFHTRNFSTDAL
jgi:DNA-directed RNA polymerase subunit RPC12/RpoP